MAPEQSTIKPTSHSEASNDRAIVALTIVGHPSLDRIGERALLRELDVGREIALSRISPEFAPLDAIWSSRPLKDPFLSRLGVTLRNTKGGVELLRGGSSMEVEANGAPLDSVQSFDAGALQRGVVLELAHRVVLVLHQLPEPPAPSVDKAVGDLGMVGASAGLEAVRSAIRRVAELDLSVLVRGESGTGKELVAKAIHHRSQRAMKPFIAVNLGAIPPSLALSELFGHVKGAFTGATGAGRGYFGAAEGGTLFLDEVGEASPEVQVMLLRALETGEVSPVGSPHSRAVDVRVIAATDADLEQAARGGCFKAPLLHRLSAYEIRLPPLRERRDDFGRLFLHFAAEELQRFGESLPNRGPTDRQPWIPASLLSRLALYAWPGNIRELRNVVRQLIIDCRGQDQLTSSPRVEQLLHESSTATVTSQDEGSIPPGSRDPVATDPGPKRRPVDIGRDELTMTLRACDFEPARAARRLGISRPSLYNLIRSHPLLRTANEVPDAELQLALEQHDHDVRATALSLQVSPRALGRRLNKEPPSRSRS